MAPVPLLLAELLFGVPGRVLWVWAWLGAYQPLSASRRGLTGLTELNLGATQASQADVKALKQALPNCKIYDGP